MRLIKNLLFVLSLLIFSNTYSQFSDEGEYFDWRFGVSKTYLDLHAGGIADFDDYFNKESKGGDFDSTALLNGFSVYKSITEGLSTKLDIVFAKNNKSARMESGKLISSTKLTAQYDLSIIPFIRNSRLDPYISAGFGYFSFGDIGEATINIGGGINYWFNESFGLVFDTSNNYYTDNGTRRGYFQHSFGLIFNLFKTRKYDDDADFEADKSLKSDSGEESDGFDDF